MVVQYEEFLKDADKYLKVGEAVRLSNGMCFTVKLWQDTFKYECGCDKVTEVDLKPRPQCPEHGGFSCVGDT